MARPRGGKLGTATLLRILPRDPLWYFILKWGPAANLGLLFCFLEGGEVLTTPPVNSDK
jgi:hypothetical protein